MSISPGTKITGVIPSSGRKRLLVRLRVYDVRRETLRAGRARPHVLPPMEFALAEKGTAWIHGWPARDSAAAQALLLAAALRDPG